ncbi:DUF222 domain-containing protein [Microlunatus elymi]|uniref:DUF222 domain-containing protein n=1 Tax=Microlunatus elymi TaxID=2596828 RepID=A0A516Q388_9ACTN|nr:HNH endonuclease signature motif containing protein [Microlunatus elymi]QDP97894.1 DUF222 domain-containing protein [Microlunatus elymi]
MTMTTTFGTTTNGTTAAEAGPAERLTPTQLDALSAQICARAAQEAQASFRLIELIGRFDAGGGLGILSGVKSVAHWVAFTCSMSPGVAREHVRVARALRQMPTLGAAFEVGAEQLAAAGATAPDVPAGTSGTPGQAGFPASAMPAQVCTIRGIGAIEPATAERLTCTANVLGIILDRHGTPLALGRSRRLVSKPQRRALMIRDRASCQFPGCHQRRHLEAHHIISWARGGKTDLANLILLCRFHHTTCHEGGITISDRTSSRESGQIGEESADHWQFTMPDGEPVLTTGWRARTAERLLRELTREQPANVDHVTHLGDPEAKVIWPKQYGERFDLNNCVQALFNIQLDHEQQAA